jgi:hypothetical protein
LYFQPFWWKQQDGSILVMVVEWGSVICAKNPFPAYTLGFPCGGGQLQSPMIGTAAGTNYSSSSMEFEEIFTFSSTRKHLIYSPKILVLPPAVIRPSPWWQTVKSAI